MAVAALCLCLLVALGLLAAAPPAHGRAGAGPRSLASTGHHDPEELRVSRDGFTIPHESITTYAQTVPTAGRPGRAAGDLLPLDGEGSSVCAPLDPSLVVYNRLPKCGSQSFLELFRSRRPYTLIHSNVYAPTRPTDVGPFLRVMATSRQQRVLYNRHVHFVHDTNAVWINVVREPVARVVSLYNYRRFSTSRPAHLREQEISVYGDLSLDECVARGPQRWRGCGLRFPSMVEWFCGYDERCREEGDGPLEMAKANIAGHFAVVGVLERLDETLAVLAHRLPVYFGGVREAMAKLSEGKAHKNKTRYPRPTEGTLAQLRALPVMQRDLALYEWVDARLTEATSCPRPEGG